MPASTMTGKYRQADEKKDKLLDVINRLAQLSYEKGTRSSDVGHPAESWRTLPAKSSSITA